MSQGRTLVIGATGAMGRAVVEQLLQDPGARVLALTRDAGSARARQLVALAPERVELVEGDLADARAVGAAMGRVDQVFCNTDYFSAGSPAAEVRLGSAALDAARAAGVGRFVWSSLDSADQLTDGAVRVPHWDSKAAVASYVRYQRVVEAVDPAAGRWFTDSVCILTTVSYFENWMSRLAPRLDTGRDGVTTAHFRAPLADAPYAMVALADVGWFVGHVLRHWDDRPGRDLRVAGDVLTGAEVAAAFEEVTGIASVWEDVPIAAFTADLGAAREDYAEMFRFFQRHDLGAERDLPWLRTVHPGLASFRDWLVRTGWRGEQRTVQRFSPLAGSAVAGSPEPAVTR